MTTPIKHYSEAELLETYYMMPEQSAPVMQHLAQCDECIARYNRLEQKLRAAAAHKSAHLAHALRVRLGMMPSEERIGLAVEHC